MKPKRKLAWRACESPHPRPLHKQCLYPGCGAELDATHWACRQHWILYPRPFRLYGHAFKNYWEGDPTYDHFAQLARDIGARLAAGENCDVVKDLEPADWAKFGRDLRAATVDSVFNPKPEAG